MVYLNVKYVIATRNYEFFNTGVTGQIMPPAGVHCIPGYIMA